MQDETPNPTPTACPHCGDDVLIEETMIREIQHGRFDLSEEHGLLLLEATEPLRQQQGDIVSTCASRLREVARVAV